MIMSKGDLELKKKKKPVEIKRIDHPELING